VVLKGIAFDACVGSRPEMTYNVSSETLNRTIPYLQHHSYPLYTPQFNENGLFDKGSPWFTNATRIAVLHL